MYSLLLVDDEPLIRGGIRKIVDWGSLGVDRIYEAGDGEEALEIVRTHPINLVLTDIVMPFMDGIELTGILHRDYPEISVIIATGHEDFEYARQSIDLGVCSYILKPIGAKNLYSKMSEIMAGIRKEDENRQYINRMRSQLVKNLPIIRSRYLNEIVCQDQGDKQQLVRQCRSAGIDFSSDSYIVGLLNLELDAIADEDVPLYVFSCRNIAQECLGERHYVFESNLSKKLVILFRCDILGDDARNTAYQVMEIILKALDNTIHVKATGGLGVEVSGPDQLPVSFRSARRACEYRFSLGENVVYDIRDGSLNKLLFRYPAQEVKSLLRSIRFGTDADIREAVCVIRQYIKNEKQLSGINVKIVLSEIVTDILKELSELSEITPWTTEQCLRLYSEISQMSSLDAMLNEIRQTATIAAEDFRRTENTSSKALIRKVKECVKMHYMELTFSLSTAADQVGVSTGYLSALFKKETGMNFIKYLTDVRMEKAMELLRGTDLRAYEIADRIGFDNTHYFSVAFKKYTGMSPSDFRKRGRE